MSHSCRTVCFKCRCNQMHYIFAYSKNDVKCTLASCIIRRILPLHRAKCQRKDGEPKSKDAKTTLEYRFSTSLWCKSQFYISHYIYSLETGTGNRDAITPSLNPSLTHKPHIILFHILHICIPNIAATCKGY